MRNEKTMDLAELYSQYCRKLSEEAAYLVEIEDGAEWVQIVRKEVYKMFADHPDIIPNMIAGWLPSEGIEALQDELGNLTTLQELCIPAQDRWRC